MRAVDQTEVTRDRFGQPILHGVRYHRASTDVLSDKTNLIAWARKDSIDRLQENPALLDMEPGDLFDLLDQSRQATEGTAIHANVHEIALHGAPLDDADEATVADAYAVLDVLHDAGFDLVCGEVFVACQELLVAGSFDLLATDPNGQAVIVDAKTGTRPGKERYAALAWAQQLSVYANGKPIDADGEIVDWSDLDLPTPSREYGVVVQVVQGSATADIGYVDLEWGYKYARLAAQVRQARKDRSLFTRKRVSA